MSRGSCAAMGRPPLTAWVATALQRFSESTLEYLADLDQAPDPTVRKDAFATDIFSAYDILFHHWLQSREAKVCVALRDLWPHLAGFPLPPPAWRYCSSHLGLFWGPAGSRVLGELCLHVPLPPPPHRSSQSRTSFLGPQRWTSPCRPTPSTPLGLPLAVTRVFDSNCGVLGEGLFAHLCPGLTGVAGRSARERLSLCPPSCGSLWWRPWGP